MPPHFLRTEQFNLKLEFFLATHQRMEVAFNSRVFIVVPMYVPPINFPILFMIDSQHSSNALAMLPFFAPPLFTWHLCPCMQWWY